MLGQKRALGGNVAEVMAGGEVALNLVIREHLSLIR